jgi:hypothetical protein
MNVSSRTPYQHQFQRLPDFEVTYQLLAVEPSGTVPIFYQGGRWDFLYDDKAYKDGLFAIYPEVIVASTGEIFPTGQPLPAYGIAAMWILSSKLRTVHQKRIKLGTRGYWMEVNHRIAVCEVSRIINLHASID